MSHKFCIRLLQKSLATTLSLALLLTSSSLAEAAALEGRSPRLELTPPARLGYITDQFETAPGASPSVILIQDLHAHYGVQKNIASLLEHLSKRMPITVALEGATGPVENPILSTFPEARIKLAAADYLMKEGELTGAEYFAIQHEGPVQLTGVEDPTFYTLHRDLFRKTYTERECITRLLGGMQQDLEALKRQHYSKRLKLLVRRVNQYKDGRVSASDVLALVEKEAQSLGLDASGLRRFKSEEFRSNLLALAHMLETQLARTDIERDLVQVDHDLALLLKVADLRATENEVRTFGPRLNQFVALAASLLKSSPDHLRGLVSSSIDYYAIAMRRNGPMVENALALLGDDRKGVREYGSKGVTEVHQSRDTDSPIPPNAHTAVLIAGGFHTTPISKILKEKRISYVVLTPNVDKLSEESHALYVKRLNGDLLTPADVLSASLDSGSRFAKLRSLFLSKEPKDPSVLHPGAQLVSGSVALMALFRAWANAAGLRVSAANWRSFQKTFSAFLGRHPSETTTVSREIPVVATPAPGEGSTDLHPSRPSRDTELIRAIGQRIEILPVKDMTQGGAGPKALKRAEKAKRILAANVRRLEKRGLTDTERTLFRFLTDTEQGRALALEWRLYSNGGFFSPAIRRVWFGRQSVHTEVNAQTGEREDFMDSRNSWFIFKHELGHVKDHYEQTPGTHLAPNEPFRVQRKVYAEYRANLYAFDWDYEKAFEATWTFNGYRELAQLLGLPKGDARAMYALVERLALEISEPLKGPVLDRAKSIIATQAPVQRPVTPDPKRPSSGNTGRRNTGIILGGLALTALWVMDLTVGGIATLAAAVPPILGAPGPGEPKRRGQPTKEKPPAPPEPFDANSDKPILLVPVNIPDPLSLGFFTETVDLYKTLRHYMGERYGVEVVMVSPFPADDGLVKRYAGEDLHLMPRKAAMQRIPRERVIGIVASFWASGEAHALSEAFSDVPLITIPKPGESAGVSGISLKRFGKWMISEEVDSLLTQWSHSPENIQTVNDDLLRSASAEYIRVTENPPFLDIDFLSRRTFGIGYAVRAYALKRYLALLIGQLANHPEAYPHGITYLYSLHDHTDYYRKGENGQINAAVLSYVNALPPLSESGRRPRVLIASPENPGEYIYYLQNRRHWIKQDEVTSRDIVMVPTPPLSKELFVKSLVTAAVQPGEWWVPSLMTGIGSYIDAAAIQVATRLPAFHDHTIAHAIGLTDDALNNFLLPEPWALHPLAPVQAFLAQTPDKLSSAELLAAASTHEVFFRASTSREMDLEAYHRFKESKELGPDLAAEVAAKLNLKPISSSNPGILAAPIIGILFGPVATAVGLAVVGYYFWKRFGASRRLAAGAEWESLLMILSDRHSTEVEAFVGTVQMPDDKKYYLGKLLQRTSLRFTLKEVESLTALLQDPTITEADIRLIDRFIDVPGITRILRRLDKDKSNRLAILAELYASQALQGVGQVVRLGEEIRDAKGQRRTDFDVVLRKPDGQFAIAEVKAGHWSQGDTTPTADEWMRVMVQSGEQKLHQLYPLLYATPKDAPFSTNIPLHSVDELIFAVQDNTSNITERASKERDLQSQLDNVNRTLAALAHDRNPLKVRAVLFDRVAPDASSLSDSRASEYPLFLNADQAEELGREINRTAAPESTIVDEKNLRRIAEKYEGLVLVHLTKEQVQHIDTNPHVPTHRLERVREGFRQGSKLPPAVIEGLTEGKVVLADGNARLQTAKKFNRPFWAYVPKTLQGKIMDALNTPAVPGSSSNPGILAAPIIGILFGPVATAVGVAVVGYFLWTRFGRASLVSDANLERSASLAPEATGHDAPVPSMNMGSIIIPMMLGSLGVALAMALIAIGAIVIGPALMMLLSDASHHTSPLIGTMGNVQQAGLGIGGILALLWPGKKSLPSTPVRAPRPVMKDYARQAQEDIRLLQGPIRRRDNVMVYIFGFGRGATAKLVVYPDRVELRPLAPGRGREVYDFARYAARALDRRLVSDKGANLSPGAHRAWGRLSDSWAAFFRGDQGRYEAHEPGEMEPEKYKTAIDEMLLTVPDPYTPSIRKRITSRRAEARVPTLRTPVSVEWHLDHASQLLLHQLAATISTEYNPETFTEQGGYVIGRPESAGILATITRLEPFLPHEYSPENDRLDLINEPETLNRVAATLAPDEMILGYFHDHGILQRATFADRRDHPGPSWEDRKARVPGHPRVASTQVGIVLDSSQSLSQIPVAQVSQFHPMPDSIQIHAFRTIPEAARAEAETVQIEKTDHVYHLGELGRLVPAVIAVVTGAALIAAYFDWALAVGAAGILQAMAPLGIPIQINFGENATVLTELTAMEAALDAVPFDNILVQRETPQMHEDDTVRGGRLMPKEWVRRHLRTGDVLAVHVEWSGVQFVEKPGTESLNKLELGSRKAVMASRASTAHPERNEDAAFSFTQFNDIHVAAVLDGMGGHKNGAEASQFVARHLEEKLQAIALHLPTDQVIQQVRSAMHETQRMLAGSYDDQRGTTAVVVISRPKTSSESEREVLIFNVGDSRAYAMMPSGILQPLTADDNISIRPDEDVMYGLEALEKKLDLNQQRYISEVESAAQLSDDLRVKIAWKLRNGVTNSFGASPEARVSVRTTVMTLPTDARVFITSDGIHDYLADHEMKRILAEHPPREGASALLEHAVARSNDTTHIRTKSIDDDKTVVELSLRPSRVQTNLRLGHAPLIEFVVDNDILTVAIPGVEHVQMFSGPKFAGRKITAGRASTADIVVSDPSVSKTHLEWEFIDGQWMFRDTSTIGTFDEKGRQITHGALGETVEFVYAEEKSTLVKNVMLGIFMAAGLSGLLIAGLHGYFELSAGGLAPLLAMAPIVFTSSGGPANLDAPHLREMTHLEAKAISNFSIILRGVWNKKSWIIKIDTTGLNRREDEIYSEIQSLTGAESPLPDQWMSGELNADDQSLLDEKFKFKFIPDHTPYLMTEEIVGVSVADHLEIIKASRDYTGQQTELSVLGILETIGRKLALLHRLGVAHRDLGPQEIFLWYGNNGPSRVQIVDFALSTTPQHPQTTIPSPFRAAQKYSAEPQRRYGDPLLATQNEKRDVYAFLRLVVNYARATPLSHSSQRAWLLAVEPLLTTVPGQTELLLPGMPAVLEYLRQAREERHKPVNVSDINKAITRLNKDLSPRAPLTMRGTYHDGELYYVQYPRQLREDMDLLALLDQPQTQKRAIELFFAPKAEAERIQALVTDQHDQQFARLHGIQTDRQLQSRLFGLQQIRMSVDSAMTSLMEGNRQGVLDALQLTEVWHGFAVAARLSNHIIRVAFQLAQANVEEVLDAPAPDQSTAVARAVNEAVHFVFNLVTPESPLSTISPEAPLILLAEDDGAISELYKRYLQRSGYRVAVFEDGAAAWEYYQQHRGEVRALITDTNMPVMRGPELVQNVKAMDPTLPVLMTSGMDKDERDEFIRNGGYTAIETLDKPSPLATLLEIVKRMVPPQPPAQSSARSLADHYRIHQVIAAWTGIAVNRIRAAISPRFRAHLFEELRAAESGLNLVLAAKGEKPVQLQPYGFDLDGQRTVSWFALWGTFGTADASDARVLQVNPFLPAGMKLRTAAHETLHVLHPDWSEAEVIKMSDVYVKARAQQILELPNTVSQAEAAVRKASPRAKLQDLIPVVSQMLKDRGTTPKQAKSISDALDPHRLAFLASA